MKLEMEVDDGDIVYYQTHVILGQDPSTLDAIELLIS